MVGTKVVQVEVGTVIEHQGENYTVTDGNFVVKGNTIYVTEKTFEKIKAEVPAAA